MPSCSSPPDFPTRSLASRGVLIPDLAPDQNIQIQILMYREESWALGLFKGGKMKKTSLFVELATTSPIPLTTLSVERKVNQVAVWWLTFKNKQLKSNQPRSSLVFYCSINLFFNMWVNLTGISGFWASRFGMKKREQVMAIAVQASVPDFNSEKSILSQENVLQTNT